MEQETDVYENKICRFCTLRDTCNKKKFYVYRKPNSGSISIRCGSYNYDTSFNKPGIFKDEKKKQEKDKVEEPKSEIDSLN